MVTGYRKLVQLAGLAPLLVAVCIMLVGTLAILTFRMLMSIGSQFESYRLFGTWFGSILNVLWITVMNVVYRLLAVKLTELENHRTPTEYENALILKTFAFQARGGMTSGGARGPPFRADIGPPDSRGA